MTERRRLSLELIAKKLRDADANLAAGRNMAEVLQAPTRLLHRSIGLTASREILSAATYWRTTLHRLPTRDLRKWQSVLETPHIVTAPQIGR